MRQRSSIGKKWALCGSSDGRIPDFPANPVGGSNGAVKGGSGSGAGGGGDGGDWRGRSRIEGGSSRGRSGSCAIAEGAASRSTARTRRREILGSMQYAPARPGEAVFSLSSHPIRKLEERGKTLPIVSMVPPRRAPIASFVRERISP